MFLPMFIEITLRQRCSPVNLLHIFRTPFPKNTSGVSRSSFEEIKTKLNYVTRLEEESAMEQEE